MKKRRTGIRRKKPPPHVLIVDTNCLWHQEKEHVVALAFQAFWEKFSSEFQLQLVIPQLVFGELLYQQISSSLTTLSRINDQFGRLSQIADRNYSHRVTEARLRTDLRKRLDKWLVKTNARLEPIPIDSIDWKMVIEGAIWRKPPFSEEKQREKGFKDSLLLETIRALCEAEASGEIAFISRDRLLRETAGERLSSFARFQVYESLDEFTSYLKLTREKLTADFIRSIQRRARNKFLKLGDEKSLFYREDIVGRIKSEFADKFALPKEGFLETFFKGTSTEGWKSVSGEKRWIQSPQFEKLEGQDIFSWKNHVTFVELYRYETASSGPFVSPLFTPNKKLRVLRFAVLWTAKVKEDGRFHNMAVDNVDFVDESFKEPIQDELDDYKVVESKTKGD